MRSNSEERKQQLEEGVAGVKAADPLTRSYNFRGDTKKKELALSRD